jgi:hypoxanthine phosphoribosyltransferase
MALVKVKDKTFRPFINKQTLQLRIAELGATISKDYAGLNPLFIGILNGSFIFAADLFRNISTDAEISFIKLASYQGTTSTGTVVTAIGLDETLNGRHVIIVEDIVDTGKTMSSFLPELMDRRPASVKIASLLIKPDALKYDVKVDYFGFKISNEFVVGYGLDYDGFGRNLPELYQIADL